MKILINLEGGCVQSVLIEQEGGEWVKADTALVAVWDNDQDLSTGDAIGLIPIEPIWVDSIINESPTLAIELFEGGF